jgi:hypothetical protein
MMKNKQYQAPIPKPSPRQTIKRCYTVWTQLRYLDTRVGGKVVWLTDSQLTFARIKYPRKEFDLVLERDLLETYKKYIDQTID